MNIARTKLLYIFFSTFLFSSSVNAIGLSPDEANAFSGFMRTLINTTSGIETSKKFCFFGNDEITFSMSKFPKNEIKEISDLANYSDCKSIYIAKDKEKGIRAQINKVKEKQIMTLAIFDNFPESGGMVLVQMGRRNFELVLNFEAMKDSALRLSPLAINLVINN